MKTLAVVMMILPLSALAAEGQATHCQRADAVRIIEVVYPQGTELPCQVTYSKQGQTKVLWRASNEAGYCEQKAAEFAEKQRSWGWRCVPVSAAGPKPDTAEQPAG